MSRKGVVLSAALVIWGLTLFDLTLLPRKGLPFLQAFAAERLVGVHVGPDATIVTSGTETSPAGPWVLTPRGGDLRVVGAHLPSTHNPRRAQSRRYFPALQTTVFDLGGANPIDVAAWRDDEPALFAVASARRNPSLSVYSLGPNPRLIVNAQVPLSPQMTDRRDLAISRWSGNRPDLFVLDRNANREKPKRKPTLQPWSIRVFSGESGFTKPILHTLIRPKLSRRISKVDWWIDVGPRHRRRPNIVLVTRDRKTGSHRTEIHLLSPQKRFRDFSLHVATALPQRVGQSNPFVFQSDRRGGAVLLVKVQGGRLKTRALSLP